MIFDPTDLEEVRWDFMTGVLENAEHRRLALKLWLAATAEDSQSPDMRGRALEIAQSNPDTVFEIHGIIAGGPMEAAKLGGASQESSGGIGFEPDEVATGGPRIKMAKAAARAGTARQIQR